MKKMENQKQNKELIFTESRTARDETINTVEYDFLDKMKAIPYLTDDMVLSIDQVSNYYDSTPKSIHTIISRNQEEFLDEVVVLKGEELKKFKEKVCYLHSEESINMKTSQLTLVTKRALLRVGMIMTNNAMATRIRNYLLNLEEDAKFDRKQWAIQREVGMIERKRMTSAISKYIPNTKHKKFAYPNYTNMLYKSIFGCDAKTLREQRSVKDNDALRDSFTKNELALVEEGETIITALISLGLTYKQIEEQVNKKFRKQISYNK